MRYGAYSPDGEKIQSAKGNVLMLIRWNAYGMRNGEGRRGCLEKSPEIRQINSSSSPQMVGQVLRAYHSEKPAVRLIVEHGKPYHPAERDCKGAQRKTGLKFKTKHSLQTCSAC
jgi:hypothetical protein